MTAAAAAEAIFRVAEPRNGIVSVVRVYVFVCVYF